jgi:hypothetical protein
MVDEDDCVVVGPEAALARTSLTASAACRCAHRVGRALLPVPLNPDAIEGLGGMDPARPRWHLAHMSTPADQSRSTDALRELDHRWNDGIDVRLRWRRHDDRVVVAVDDEKTGARFSIEVPVGGDALDVFQHPFAYAAWQGIDTRSEASDVTAAALRLPARDAR